MSTLVPADIEIYEPGSSDGAIVVCPREVRINGVQLATSADHPVVVHEANLQHADAVYVTVTFLARRVRVGFHDELGQPPNDAQPQP